MSGKVFGHRVEAPITDYLRDFASDLEKYKMVQFFLVHEDRNKEDCKKIKKIDNFIFDIEILRIFEVKSWFEHIINV